ncbi:MAG: flavodoxin family protein [Spirochaetia bacterium]|nr:flavodoxin family protein [Spirochaetia bacterium]
MKTIVINASPRKNWNTAQLLKSAQKGAESAGSETEYIDLYDLKFTGCRSCLACKRKGAERCKCYWKDDLSPLIDRITQAQSLIIGSPIYFGEPTAQFRALLERLLFVMLSYDNYSTYFTGKVNVGLIYTMNASGAYVETLIKPMAKNMEDLFRFLNGTVKTYLSCNTTQVADYSKYSMAGFDVEKKKETREKQFPIDLEEAYKMGRELAGI